MLKKVGLFVLVLVAAAVVVSAAMAQDAAAPAAATETAVAAPVAVNNTVCPVCGNAITNAGENTVEASGKVYGTCCAACKEEFGKDAAKYAAKADESMKPAEVVADAPAAPAETAAQL